MKFLCHCCGSTVILVCELGGVTHKAAQKVIGRAGHHLSPDSAMRHVTQRHKAEDFWTFFRTSGALEHTEALIRLSMWGAGCQQPVDHMI